MLRTFRAHAWAIVSYALVAVVFSWPLPLGLDSRLTGPIAGDTGVYVWNLWLFRHEVVAHGRFPLFTLEILSLTPPVSLGLHNYTLFADVLAFPLIPRLGVTATFNVLYLAMTVLTAWAMFALARSIVRRAGEAWLAGLLFGFSPVLVARGTAHFSLVAAAPLPLFLLALRRAVRERSARFAASAGAAAAWASMCDAYYGIFCLLVGCCYLATRYTRIERAETAGATSRGARIVEGAIVCAIAVIVLIAATGGTELRLLRLRVALRSLYTPVLALTLLVALRTWLRYRSRFALRPPPLGATLRLSLAGAAACLLLLGPLVAAAGSSLADGGALHGPIYWRSSPPGVDLLSLFMPNPNHGWFGRPWHAWLATQPGGYVENVASLTVTGVAVIAFAVWRHRFRPSRAWIVMAMFFGALALGPFVHVAGVNTYVPGPWALMRYVPILTATRTPARYGVALMMAFAIVFAQALGRITAARPRRRNLVLTLVGAALLFELAPFPRTLYSARVPEIYRRIGSDPRNIRVLELPLGFRDGEWSEGDFTAASQFYQTFHEKPLIGGYLSRISDRELRRQRASITVSSLIRLSEGQQLPASALGELKRRAPGFVDRARLGYVVIDVPRTPPALRRFAIDAYGLVKVGESAGRELYVPTVGIFAAGVGSGAPRHN